MRSDCQTARKLEYLFCHFLPVQPEDHNNVESGMQDNTNEQPEPKACREKTNGSVRSTVGLTCYDLCFLCKHKFALNAGENSSTSQTYLKLSALRQTSKPRSSSAPRSSMQWNWPQLVSSVCLCPRRCRCTHTERTGDAHVRLLARYGKQICSACSDSLTTRPSKSWRKQYAVIRFDTILAIFLNFF